MREIKFRTYMAGYTTDEKRMFYNYDPFILGMDNPRCPPVMQYTGLKDKNGKEIYEGDIVKVTTLLLSSNFECVKQVEFKGGMFGVKLAHFYPDNDSYLYKLCNWAEFEIIGNIHENKELLEDK